MRHKRWLVLYVNAFGVPTVYRSFDHYHLAVAVAATMPVGNAWVAPNPEAVAQALLGEWHPEGRGTWEVALWQEVLSRGAVA